MAPVAKRPAASSTTAAKAKGRPKAKAAGKAAAKTPAGRGVAAKAATPAPKRQKLDSADRALARLYQTVAAGLQQASCVPEHVKSMLLEMLEGAVLTYKDDRHKYQQAVVGMAGEVFSSTEAELMKVFDEAKVAETQAEEANEAAERTVQEAENLVKKKQEEADARKQMLTEHAQAFKDKTEAVRQAEASDQSLASNIKATISDQEALSKVTDEYVKPLVVGVEVERRAQLLGPLVEEVQKLELDRSIIVALPDALGKDPDNRGPFDKQVVQAAELELERRRASLAEQLEQFEQQKNTSKVALTTAQDAFEAANQQQQQSAQALWDAQAEVKNEAEKVETVQAETRTTMKQLRASSKVTAGAEKKLTVFRNGPLGAFIMLQDRVPEPPQKIQEPAVATGELATDTVGQDQDDDVEVHTLEAKA